VESLPSPGAWIETEAEQKAAEASSGRSPHRERGLKPGSWLVGTRQRGSLPSPGAWIETQILRPNQNHPHVAPLTGSVD